MQMSTGNEDAQRKLAGVRLLLVEDNELNQELALELLRSASIQVTLAEHGAEAIEILNRGDVFDGVLMDCQMPVMDGYMATREIRSNPAWAKLPIIAMTANTMAGDRERALEAGMNDHIAKPLRIEEMFSTIAQWIKPSSASNDVKGAGTRGGGWLENLSGINVRAGLANCLNKEDLYRRMLLKFLEGQGREFAGAFAAARGLGDTVLALRLVHTLRGSSGTIGATTLQGAAEKLELACRNAPAAEEIDALFAVLCRELDYVVSGITRGVAGVAVEAPSVQPVDRDKVLPLLTRLIALLEGDFWEAQEIAEQLQRALENTAQHAVARKLTDYVCSFEVDRALQTAKALNTAILGEAV